MSAGATVGATDGPTPNRHRIGLVLGGGGAKGAAHIGVLGVLEELRVPVDCVAGTSMGALVGATFAAGNSAAEIEDAVLAIDWSQTVGGRDQRGLMPIERKLARRTYSNSAEFGIYRGGLRAPTGFIGTQRIEGVIRDLVADSRLTHDFDDLPIPFRAVATDMVTGSPVILGQGDLAVAMRASMALPGAFAPVVLGDRVLADGGMMRNLPVDVARELCADVVIAVWLTSPAPDPAHVASALAVVGRSLDVMIAANERAQIATLTEADVGIGVPMGDIGTVDFARAGEAIELGRAAAEAARLELMRYSVSEADYATWRSAIQHPSTALYHIADVKIVGLDRVNPDYVEAQLQRVAPGAEVDVRQVNADAERVYAVGDFESVEYRFTGPSGARVLEIAPVEKSWGPDLVRFDFGMSTVDGGNLHALLRAEHEKPWINALGGRWHNAGQVGQQTRLSSDLYQPLDVRQRFFVQPTLALQNDLTDVYLDGDRVARYRFREWFGQLDAGINFGTTTQARIGLRRGWLEADLDTGPPQILPELERSSDGSLRLGIAYDTRDSAALATHGTYLSGRYVDSLAGLEGDFDYRQVEGALEQVVRIGGNSLSVILAGGKVLNGDAPVTESFELGGIRTFPGLRPGELRGDRYWVAGTSHAWRLLDLQPLFGQALYAGVRLQAGEMESRVESLDGGVLYGVSGSLSGRTPLGPVLLSLGYVDNGTLRLQFTLGRPLAEGSLLDEIY